MELTEKKLLKKKEEINDLKDELNQLKGKEELLFKQLKTEWGCSTIEEAKKQLSELEKKEKQLSIDIDNKLEYLEQEFFND